MRFTPYTLYPKPEMKTERLPLTIGTCVDRGGIAGLEVLLRSLVSAHPSNARFHVHVLHRDIPERTRHRLSDTIYSKSAGRVASGRRSTPERYFKGRVVFGLMSYARTSFCRKSRK